MVQLSMNHMCILVIIVKATIATNQLHIEWLSTASHHNESYAWTKVWFNDTKLFGQLKVFQEVPKLWFQFELKIRRSNSRTYESITQSSKDYCTFMQNPMNEPLTSMAFHAIRANPKNKIFDRCPIAKDIYHFEDFEIDTKQFPTFWPNMRFNISYAVTFLMPERVQAAYIEFIGVYRNPNQRTRKRTLV